MDDVTHKAIVAWCEANPYRVYADYRDELPKEVVQALLDGDSEALWNYESEVTDNAWPYVDWDDMFNDMCKALDIDDDADDIDDIRELFDESTTIVADDYIETAARNTRLHFVATPYIGEPGQYLSEEDQPDGLFLFPHAYCSDEENERRRVQLRDVLGIMSPEEAETCYEFDTLKIIGSIDVSDLIKEGAPTHITIDPEARDNIITHNRVNGSGGCGTVAVTKGGTFPAMFRIDDGDRYGVDSVFGFVGEVWRRPLKWERHEPAEA